MSDERLSEEQLDFIEQKARQYAGESADKLQSQNVVACALRAIRQLREDLEPLTACESCFGPLGYPAIGISCCWNKTAEREHLARQQLTALHAAGVELCAAKKAFVGTAPQPGTSGGAFWPENDRLVCANSRFDAELERAGKLLKGE